MTVSSRGPGPQYEIDLNAAVPIQAIPGFASVPRNVFLLGASFSPSVEGYAFVDPSFKIDSRCTRRVLH
jgi:hypothetical protein